jgi:hypothetical protein
MNRPICLLLIAVVAILLSTAFIKKDLPKEAPRPATASRQQLFYWYDPWYDQFNDWKTIAQEEWELWALYGAPVDQSSSAGTLIMKGYPNNAYPHNTLPMVLLYAHFLYIVDGPGRKAQ